MQAQAAKDPKLKAKLLKEFYSLMPHHKSTERLEVSIKKQIANLEANIKVASARKTGSTKVEWVVQKDTFPQITLSGPLEQTTSLFKALTGLEASYFELHRSPIVGAYKSDGLTFQVIFTPFDPRIGRQVQEKMIYLIKSSDLLLIALPSQNWEDYWNTFNQWTLGHNLEVSPEQAVVELKNVPTGGIRIVGKSKHISEAELIQFLQSYSISNCIIKLSSDATLDDVEAVIFGRAFKRCAFVAPYDTQLKGIATSSYMPRISVFDHPRRFDEMLLSSIGLIRVYTRSPNGIVAQRPLLVGRNTRIIDIAKDIHKDLWRNFKYAKIWRKHSTTPIRVGKDFRVNDLDIIEVFD
jgi:ribosome-interacting GTPase 1